MCVCFFFFFFKQKTAYEIYQCDWSSDVCSSDLTTIFASVTWHDPASATDITLTPSMTDLGLTPIDLFYLIDAGGERDMPGFDEIGRASCRERV